MRLGVGFILFLYVTILLLLGGCSSEMSGGPGTGTETTNGIVLSSEGTPVDSAFIYIIDSENWRSNVIHEQSVILDTIVTGSDGSFVLPDTTLPMHYNLQVDSRFEGALISNNNTIVSGDSIIIQLHHYARYEGEIENYWRGFSNEIAIEGTNYTAEVKFNGYFEIPKIPEGIYPVFTKKDSLVMISIAKVKPDTTLIHKSLNILPNSVLLDDFESGKFKITVLGQSTGSEWYSYSDEGKEFFNSLSNQKILKDDNDHYLKFTASLSIDDSETWNTDKADSLDLPYTGVGFNLGESYKTNDTVFDLSELDSLTFKARGSGVITVKFGSKYTDSLFGESNDLSISIPMNNNDSWSSYSIDPRNLKNIEIYGTKTIGWDDIATSIIRIEFEFNGTNNKLDELLSIELDDIYLHGFNLEEMF